MAGRFEHFEACVGAGVGYAVCPGAVGHSQVGDDDIEGSTLEFVHSLISAVDDGANVTWPAKGIGHHVGMIWLIVHDQHLGARGINGW